MVGKLIRGLRYVSFRCSHPSTRVIGVPWLHSCYSGFYSQSGQDAFLYSEFYRQMEGSSFPKTFLDIGCNHPIRGNNTYFFEKRLGFRGLAVDASDRWSRAWAAERPDAKFVHTAVGERDGSARFQEVLGEGEADMYSSIVGASDKAEEELQGAFVRRESEVPLARTQRLLDEAGLHDIGVASIDVEGFEPAVLKGIDFTKTRIMALVVENDTPTPLGGGAVRELLQQHGYIFYARIWYFDDVFVSPALL